MYTRAPAAVRAAARCEAEASRVDRIANRANREALYKNTESQISAAHVSVVQTLYP